MVWRRQEALDEVEGSGESGKLFRKSRAAAASSGEVDSRV